MLAPIVVMSFNRPEMLRQVLQSLKLQESAAIEDREVHLFQDNAVNAYSRLRYARDEDIFACVEVFKSEFPSGIVHLSPKNIGVCENFKRAEEYVFEDRKFECAYFF